VKPGSPGSPVNGASPVGRLPNFLYIGPDKAGSSWLHEALLRHPQVFLTEAKDLYFFDRYYDRGLAWYQAQFRRAGPEHRVVGEVCQDYLFEPRAPQRIRRCLGEVNLMATLREPAARAHSSYLYMRKHGIEVGTFRAALDARPELLEHGRYGTALRRFLAVFPARRLHLALFDDLQQDPQAFLDATTTWLGITRLELGQELLAARLPASQARSTTVARLVRGAAEWTREHDGAAVVGRVKRSRWVQRALYRPVGEGAQRVDPDDVAYVWDRLGAEIDTVDALFGLDLRRRWGRAAEV
jgi:hypothetical protein